MILDSVQFYYPKKFSWVFWILTTGWKTDILLIIFPERRRTQIFLCRLSTETCPLVLAFSISLLSNPHLQKIDLKDFSYELFQKCKRCRLRKSHTLPVGFFSSSTGLLFNDWELLLFEVCLKRDCWK